MSLGKSKGIPSTETEAFRFGEFELFPSERQLHCRHASVPLPPKAFDALLLLVRRAEQLVRKEELTEALWPDTFVTEANLTNTVEILRKALGHDAIQTVSKFGYRFRLPVLGEPGIHQKTYETFVRAKELTNERSLDSLHRARDLYWFCIAEDPVFAPAWAWLGRCSRMIEKFTSGGAEMSFHLAHAALKRSLAIDPDLACAHHFYTQLQADCGEAPQAMERLLARLQHHGEEPESFAGLVQVLRFCGLLEESVAAHRRARMLDPALMTSISHTYFLLGEYEAAIETYGRGKGYYLDAAAWAARGDAGRAIDLLRERLAGAPLSPLMSALMGSLLAILEGRHGDACAIMSQTEILREPEVLYYLARHFAMASKSAEAVATLQNAVRAGFHPAGSMERDAVWNDLRGSPQWQRIAAEARQAEDNARRILEQAGGGRLLTAAA
jgi:DNA-binding winged helix-turn-helix (wHTH) protein